MANICLVTKLKGTINNDSLPKLGELIIPMVENTTVDSSRWLEFAANEEIVVSTDGVGLFGTSASNYNLTTYTIPANTTKKLYFNKGTYGVHISNKYALTYFGNGSSGDSSATPVTLDVSDLKYSTSLNYLRLGIGNSYGNIANLNKLSELNSLSLVKTKCTGNIGAISNLINLNSLRVYNSDVYGTVEEFVAGQIAAGRTTCNTGELECRGLLTVITFGEYKDTSIAMEFLSWTDSEHINLYVSSKNSGSYNYTDITKIYTKGATAEQVSQWESDGKTVVVVDDDGE